MTIQLTDHEIQWSSTVTATVDQASTSSVSATSLTITSQASTGTPGNIILNVPAPVGAGTAGKISLQNGGVEYGKVDLSGIWASTGQTTQILMGQWGFSSSYAGLFVGANATSQTSTNYTLICDGSNTYLNAPSGSGSIQLGLANGTTGAVVIGAASVTTSIQILQWSSTVSGPVLAQANESTVTKGQDLTIQPQQSAHATDFGGGNLIIALQVPGGAGAEANFKINRGVAEIAQIGLLTTGSLFTALWMGASISPTSSTYTLTSDGTTYTILNAPTSGQLILRTGNANVADYNSTLANFWTLQSSLQLLGSTVEFGVAVASPTITQVTPGSDVAAINMTIQAQSAEATASTHLTGGNLILQAGSGATTNGTPGNVLANIPPLSGSGSEGYFGMERNGSLQFAVGSIPGQAGAQGGLWLGAAGLAPSGSNFTMQAAGSFLSINTPGTLMDFEIAVATIMQMTANGLQIGTTASFGSGANVLGISNATTAPTTNPSGGGVLYASGGALYWRSSSGTITTIAPV
jgi:hypothetical protein